MVDVVTSGSDAKWETGLSVVVVLSGKLLQY
jgi:hypothetical protein